MQLNEWDGSVTMEIQGEPQRIDQVLRAIEAGRYVEIETMKSREVPLEDERSFRTED